MKIVLAEKVSSATVDVFAAESGWQVVTHDQIKNGLAAELVDADALVVRSAVQADDALMAAAPKLRVIGRAGVGVDNIDADAATRRGIIVMNTPGANAVAVAELTIGLMLALGRKLPQANTSMHAGRWEKKSLQGVELRGKKLGILGLGRIGLEVARRARVFGMEIIGHDPYVSAAIARENGIRLVTADELFREADYLTLHVGLTPQTTGIVNQKTIATMKKGVRIINCARGGLVNEDALYDALISKKVAGAALDVFEVEPANTHKLFDLENVVCTPHLGASTGEAQENVALQVAEQMADYLISGAVTNALNMPSISADEAPRLKPYIALAEKLGSFAGQLTDSTIEGIIIEYAGDVGEMNTKALSSAALAGILQTQMGTINMVSAPIVAKERGIKVDEVKQTKRGAYETYIRITVKTDKYERAVAGTVFTDGRPRIIQIKGIELECNFGKHMLYITNNDKPGFVGRVGTLLGNAGINMGTFHLGRIAEGGAAISIIETDGKVPQEVMDQVQTVPNVIQVKALQF